MHFLGPLSYYECSENLQCSDNLKCSQSFQNLNGLRRHIIRKHSVKNIRDSNIHLVEEPPINTNVRLLITDNENTSVRPIVIDNADTNITNYTNATNNTNNTNNCTSVTNNFNLKEALNNLNLSAVKFSLQLHNNNNFSRKDVINIQNEISDKILNSIVLLLNNFMQISSKDPLFLSTTNVITSEISEIFKFCKSEHLFNKWLTKHDYTADVKQFTINNEINVVSNSSENVVYDEIHTKGVLFPLKFQFIKYFEQNDILNQSLQFYNELITSDNGFFI